MITKHQLLQGSDEWHELRSGLYTGSNAHKLLRYGARSYSLTEQTSFGGNFYTKRGHILEEEAVEMYEAIFGSTVERPGFVTNTDFQSCGYSPDGIVDQTLIEVKCFNEKKHLEILKGEIPINILAQIHFGMMICDLKQAQLIIYNPDIDAEVAFKAIDVKQNRNILNNFKNILSKTKEARI
jgi:hypothetical protein